MKRDYTALFLFCGLGGGALGFQRAATRLFGNEARFRSIGGIDCDAGACADFEYLTKSPALLADLATMTPGALREFAGPVAPDVVFDSAPCKSHSGLTNRELAKTQKYVDMARLYVTSVELLLSTWDVPPRLIIKENVPRILSSGAELIDEVTKMLESAGYAVHLSTHDCGELGGLAQHRRRALMVARLKSKVSSLLYVPPKRRVRSCGEVLGELPLPESPSAGPMHRMPRIGWLTWVRLALIPAGGDHRDLPGALDDLQKRRDVWARHHVERWGDPSVTVAGDGSNGSFGVADPRVEVATTFANSHTVEAWEGAARTVTAGSSRPIAGGPSVADPRVNSAAPGDGLFSSLGVKPWSAPASTVTGMASPTRGPHSVADPRIATGAGARGLEDAPGDRFHGSLGVVRWDGPIDTVTSGSNPAKGPFSVADVRVGRSSGRNGNDHCYYVLPWADPSFTVAGKAHAGTGAYSVGDPRVTEGLEDELPLGCAPRAGAYGVIDWKEAARTITAAGSVDNGPFAIADMRVPDVQPLAFIDGAKRPPFVMVGKKRVSVPVVILAADETWHRPMTPLELARLQDLPAFVDGQPLKLAGDNVGAWVERIGNAVPVGAAQAIAEQMLTTLLASDVGAGLAPSGGVVWVDRAAEVEIQ